MEEGALHCIDIRFDRVVTYLARNEFNRVGCFNKAWGLSAILPSPHVHAVSRADKLGRQVRGNSHNNTERPIVHGRQRTPVLSVCSVR
jgi:hypothetical protein